jgi:hypothetical protein
MESRLRVGLPAAPRSGCPTAQAEGWGWTPRLDTAPGHRAWTPRFESRPVRRFFMGNLHSTILTEKRIERNTDNERVSPIPVQIT